MTFEKRTPTPEQATEQLKTLINGTFNRSYDLESVMKLVRLGADPNTKSANGQSLLHILTMRINNVARVNSEAIEELVKSYHANIEIQDSEGCTPLQCLINNDFLAEEAMDLIRLGANPDTKSNNGESLLHTLTWNISSSEDKLYPYVTFHNTIRELVIEYKANINIQNAQGETPLHYLIDKRCFYSALRLVRLGANPNIVSDQGSFLYLLSVHPRFWVCIEELVKKFHANIEIQDANGCTPLQRLIDDRQYPMGMFLVRLGANPNTRSANSGKSLLHCMMSWSSDKEDWPVEDLVVRYGANINIKDAKGHTPLQYLIACINPHRRKYTMVSCQEHPMQVIRLGDDLSQTKKAMQLIHLGANPFVEGRECRRTLLEQLSANSRGEDPYIPELHQAMINFSIVLNRREFLNLLFLLSYDRYNQSSKSSLSKLPEEQLHIIFSFVFGDIGKTPQERYFLAHTILSQPQIVKEMAQTKGVINVVQGKNQETGIPKFVFFKSIQNSRPCNRPEIQSQLTV